MDKETLSASATVEAPKATKPTKAKEEKPVEETSDAVETKLLLLGKAGVGKTTFISKLPEDETFVIYFDGKKCPIQTPHTKFTVADEEAIRSGGLAVFKSLVNQKLRKFMELYGKKPRYVVLDSVSYFATAMEEYFGVRKSGSIRGFDRWTFAKAEILALLDYLRSLGDKGCCVIYVSHLGSNEAGDLEDIVGKRVNKNVGLYGMFDNAISIEVVKNKRIVYLNNHEKFARTTLEDVPEFLDSDQFDFVEHIQKLEAKNHNVNKYAL